ncbi:MAG: AI-2E family transporter [Anaerolineae bacterium]|nr:AI-2E family transporter [Anaerolineae bacterium]
MEMNASQSTRLRPLLNIMLMLASFVVVVFGMREAAEVVTPILMAFILAVLFAPVQQWLLDRGVPAWLALIVVLLIVLLVVSVLISVTVVSISRVIDRLPVYQAALQRMIDQVVALTADLPFEVADLLTAEVLNVSRFLSVAGNLLGGVVDTFSNWFVVILLVAFMLTDFALLPQKLEVMFDDRERIAAITDLMASIRSYLSITTWTGLLTGVANALLLVVLGVDFPILWGMLGFLMNYIPNIGIFISIIPPAIVALLEFGWKPALVVVIGFELTNMLVENILKPRVMGEELNISPLFIFLSLVLWSFVLGPIGTILAVPLTLIAIKLVLETSEEVHWLAVLMTARPRRGQRRSWLRSRLQQEPAASKEPPMDQNAPSSDES